MISTNRTLLFAVAATCLIATTDARAQFNSYREFTGTLTGGQEVPGVSTTATGTVRLSLRKSFFGGPFDFFPPYDFDLQANFAGLTGGWTEAGIYGPAEPGQTGPLIADFADSLRQLPPDATSGTLYVMNYYKISQAQVEDLLAGKVYFNLRSTAFRGGELRGQLMTEPAAPIGGAMALSPLTPVVPGATLTVHFRDWLDASLPLTYAVLVDGVVVSAQGASASPSFTGPSAPGTHTITGRIYDSGNNVAEVTQSFTVEWVSTGTAAPVAATGATLNGMVNANGSRMEVFFDASIDGVNFISYPAIPGTVTGNGNVAVTAALTNLTPKTDYQFRVRGVNSMETFIGATRTFTTPGDGGLVFSNTTGLVFPAGKFPNFGEASPYPSVIPVAGVSANISSLRVQLNGFFHHSADDVDVFVMSPAGAVAALMSDAGRKTGLRGFYGDIEFDDAAATTISDQSPITPGTYIPSNNEPNEAVPKGGVGPIGTSLKSLAAGGVNGEWKLFVTDDVQYELGRIKSWSLVLETNTAHEAWRRFYFGSAGNTGDAADNFDYDKDGLSNLLEWACNLNPTTPGSTPIAASRNGENLELTYSRSVSALKEGADFAVEWSDTLTTGSWSSTNVTETILSDNGTRQEVKATIPAGPSSHRFVHLKVSAP
jgi:hypothetical protein